MDFNYPYSGNLSLLDRPAVAFFASREVSQTQRRQALRWAEEIIPAGKAVISGFQSPLEKEVFGRLLAARHPIIWALGRALYKRYPPQVEGPSPKTASWYSPPAAPPAPANGRPSPAISS